ncbi:MAG: DUF2271 domain-containing protein [Isosphaeraceae bacterium]
MSIRRVYTAARCAGLLCCVLAAGAAPAPREFEFRRENVLGTSFELRVSAGNEAAAQEAEARVLAEIDRLAGILSGYDPSSEFRRWQGSVGEPKRVSPELFALLRASDQWRERSQGAFNPQVQILTELWTKSARLGRLPTAAERAEVQKLLAQPAWRLDVAKGTAEHLTTCPLSLNSIAKGFIIGKACEAGLDRKRGVSALMLNIGGDIRVVGDVARTIGIAPALGDSETTAPVARVAVRDRSVATSGNAQRGFRIQGRWYSHIFDPRTGEPAGKVLSATVIAAEAADANALATTLNVLPVEDGLELVASVKDAECLIATDDGRLHASPGWSSYERAAPAGALASPKPAGPESNPEAAPARSWADDFELRVNFEINGPENQARGYRRPYVAVWVEDKDGLTARTLVLWLMARQPGPRWHPDLKRWYRDDQVRKLADDANLIETISRPTRPPGKYSITWDGKDDHGKPLPPGAYTLCIEAAREHGTYQLMRKDVTIADAPFTEELKGNVEIKGATLEYRRKTAAK